MNKIWMNTIFIHENGFENVFCKMVAIFFEPQRVNLCDGAYPAIIQGSSCNLSWSGLTEMLYYNLSLL